MRCTPLAVFCHKLDPGQLEAVVRSDVGFTHSNPTVIDAVFLYCFAIGKLLNGASGQDAFDLTVSLA